MWDLLLPVLLVSSLTLNLLLFRAVVPPDVASPVTACFVIAERLRGAVSLLRGAGLAAGGARASARKSPVQLPRHMVPVRLEDEDEENPVCGGSLHDDRPSAAGPQRSRQDGGDGPDEEERGSEIASDIARPRCSSKLWGVGNTPGAAEAASSVDGSEEPGDAAAALATRKKQVQRIYHKVAGARAWLGSRILTLLIVVGTSLQRLALAVPGLHPQVAKDTALARSGEFALLFIMLHLSHVGLAYRLVLHACVTLSLATSGWGGDSRGWTQLGQPFDTLYVVVANVVGAAIGHCAEVILRRAFFARHVERRRADVVIERLEREKQRAQYDYELLAHEIRRSTVTFSGYASSAGAYSAGSTDATDR
ncbi:hypothetical protein EMIHUDRAFT_108564 [Emiliania huxleyi CCMP1516]|uniref:Uncharacterized protein n=2 Tax=Emiliania huxleyi TaxID=2903 RepID=A0A0D3KX82_EMIH1|nr:hypothetical protein EMIHUDRAFT_108564 [Emiliania huxleyi CCMP1516]EOD40367.1 hypothetical protein EMIHUDRAFT_108564 [Emiliania huxleyi CCMP1516]|eukprot:XP_005792796.1 hypothetical protein EMIHUDRAFT_108564 [Emiliania huxleyi CCMP1516]